jgi:hypothetical protein
MLTKFRTHCPYFLRSHKQLWGKTTLFCAYLVTVLRRAKGNAFVASNMAASHHKTFKIRKNCPPGDTTFKFAYYNAI